MSTKTINLNRNKYDRVYDWTDAEIEDWISEHKVLFMTNSMCRPGSMFLSSIMTYAQLIPVHNFTIIYGIKDNKPYYGINVFGELTERAFNDPTYSRYDYAVYIDEDCFVADFRALMTQVVRFVEQDCWPCAGPMDGGMICHRNHSRFLFNTYVSMWNMKMLRESTTLIAINELMGQFMKNQNTHTNFLSYMSQHCSDVLQQMDAESMSMIAEGQEYRQEHFEKIDDEMYITPYAKVVMNDPTNSSEPHQTPYSYKDNEAANFEPYYIIEELWIALTGKAPLYLFHTDLYDKELNNDEDACTDNSGLTSALYSTDRRLAVVHTWFSRMYTKFPINNLQLEHTNRINCIITKYGYI